MQNDLRYTGSRLVLRAATADDAAEIVRWRNDPAVYSHFVYRTPLTVEGHLTWFHEQVETGRVAQFIICLKEGTDDCLRGIGSVYLRDIDREEGSAEYGIFIGEADARGKGFGVEAARLALRYAFEEMCLRKVFLRVYEDNLAAIRSYEAAGFRRTGTLAQVTSTDGSVQDMLLMEAHPAEENA